MLTVCCVLCSSKCDGQVQIHVDEDPRWLEVRHRPSMVMCWHYSSLLPTVLRGRCSRSTVGRILNPRSTLLVSTDQNAGRTCFTN